MADYKLKPLPRFDENPRYRYKVKALEINGRCETETVLLELYRSSKVSFKKLTVTVEAFRKDGFNINSKRYSKDFKGRPIFELKELGGIHRLFCFFSRDKTTMILVGDCGYKKSSGKQSEAFDNCFDIMILFYKEYYHVDLDSHGNEIGAKK